MRDVIVIGGGPAGLYTALLGAGEGLDVLVLEEHGEIGRPTHCTGLVSAETHELYKIPDHAVLSQPSACRVHSPDGTVAEFRSPGEELFVLDRAAFDQTLAAGAREAGATVTTGCRVDAVRVTPRWAEVVTGDGQTLRARCVVLACGVTYRFHRGTGSDLPEAFLHSAQLEMEAEPGEALEIHLGRELAPDGFAWVVPIRRGDQARLKAGVLLRGDARAHLGAFLRRPDIASRLRGVPGEPIRRLLPMRPTKRSYGDRMVAVGDAAGLTKPVTGGGIFYSLLSGAFAVETLVEALASDDLSAKRLSRYESQWRQRLMPEIRASGWFRYLITKLSDRELDAFVAAAASEDVRAAIARTARFNWHRSVILAVLRRPGIKSILLRSLFR